MIVKPILPKLSLNRLKPTVRPLVAIKPFNKIKTLNNEDEVKPRKVEGYIKNRNIFNAVFDNFAALVAQEQTLNLIRLNYITKKNVTYSFLPNMMNIIAFDLVYNHLNDIRSINQVTQAKKVNDARYIAKYLAAIDNGVKIQALINMIA